MSPVLRRGARTPRPTDGAMTLVEHLYELRNRLFKASLGIVAGMVFALFFATEILDFLSRPYRQALQPLGEAGKKLIVLGPTDFLILQLKVGLYAGLLISAPIWLYQLWSFITPGLHRHERRWAYAFVAVATPLFAAGEQELQPLGDHEVGEQGPGAGSSVEATLELTRYIDFVTSMMLLFGIGLEFPLVVMMLNLVGLVSARRLLSWWRVAVFLMFLFAAFVTPTPDPFGMIALALPMSALYFAAVGVAFLNDRRRARAALVAGVAALSDDETSPLDERLEEVEPAAPLDSGHDPDRRHDPDDRP
jgi:sec-independent protein translocase protein TatC